MLALKQQEIIRVSDQSQTNIWELAGGFLAPLRARVAVEVVVAWRSWANLDMFRYFGSGTWANAGIVLKALKFLEIWRWGGTWGPPK